MAIQNVASAGISSRNTQISGVVGKNSKKLEKIIERLSTAKRINRASDDAAGLSISEQLSSQSRGFKMASQNVSDALAALSIADGAVNEMEEMVQRQRELAIQAKNDTLTDDQRKQLDVEFQNLTKEVDRIAQGTNYNRQNLLNSRDLGDGSRKIQAGSNAGEMITLPGMDLSSTSLGTTSLSISTASGAADALAGLDRALNTMNTQRSTIGGVMNRFESTQNNLAVAEVNTQAAESAIRDDDMAMSLAEMIRSSVIQDSSISVFKRFNEITLNRAIGLLQ